MIGLPHPKPHCKSRRSWRKLSMHPPDKQVSTECPHHLLYGFCSKNKNLPLHLMSFINSTINQCHLVESKMLTWTTASKSYLSWIYNLSKNLPCSAGSWSIKYMSLKHCTSVPLTFQKPAGPTPGAQNTPPASAGTHLYSSWTCSQQLCTYMEYGPKINKNVQYQGKKNPVLIYSDCSSS